MRSNIKLFDLDTKFWFGEYIGKTLNDLIAIKPVYIDWCAINLDIFVISENTFRQIEKFNQFSYSAIKQLTAKSKKYSRNDQYLTSSEIDSRWLSKIIEESWRKGSKYTNEIREAFLNNLVTEYENCSTKRIASIDNRDYDFNTTYHADVARTIHTLHNLMKSSEDGSFSLDSPKILKSFVYFSFDFLKNAYSQYGKNYCEQLCLDSFLKWIIVTANDYNIKQANCNKSREDDIQCEWNWLEDAADSIDPEDMTNAYWNID